MKTKYSCKFLLRIFSAVIFFTLSLQSKENPNQHNSHKVIENMGAGFNLGNTFENGFNSTSPEEIKPIIELYIKAGMKHIRIPVTWMEGFDGDALTDQKGNINFEHNRFLKLKEVIDFSLSKGLYVVINTHHERGFKEHYDGSSEFNNKFENLWKGIANYFKDYPQHLIFELMNEPEGAFGDWSGGRNPSDSLAISLTRAINKVGYNAIRKTGGLNEFRIIMIATNGMGNHTTIEEVFPSKEFLPGNGMDPYLAIQVHTYDPWSFCGQDGSNLEYPGNDIVKNSIIKVAEHSKLIGIPVNYGEYGVGRAKNEHERNTEIVREFYRTVVETTYQNGMSSTVWDDRGWFGLIQKDRTNDKWKFINNIVPYMLGN